MDIEQMLLEMTPGYTFPKPEDADDEEDEDEEDEDEGGGAPPSAAGYMQTSPPGYEYFQPALAAPPGAELRQFIQKYRMSPEMSEELLGLLRPAAPRSDGGVGLVRAAGADDWNHTSPQWRQQTKKRAQ